MIEPIQAITTVWVKDMTFRKGKFGETEKVISADSAMDIVTRLNEVIEHINKSENLVFDEKKLAEVLSQKQVTVFKEGGVVGFRTNQWIPCSERLPEAGKRYLVSAIWKDGDFEKHSVYDAVYGTDGIWHTHNYEPVSYEVIAWMPLPTVYEREGVNNE